MLEVKQIQDLDELMDQIYAENHPEDKSNTVYKLLINFAVEKLENKKSSRFSATQIRNLENIAYTSNNLSDIKNYIKGQVGKDTRETWVKVLKENKCFGKLLLEQIEEVERKAKSKHDSIEFKLKAVREFIHQFVSDYLYNSAVGVN